MHLISLTFPSRSKHSRFTAMRAPVDEGVDPARSVARDDHRRLADRRGDVIARIRDLCRETQKAPGRAFEDPLLLEPILLGIGVEPERDLAEAVRRPRDPPHRIGTVL